VFLSKLALCKKLWQTLTDPNKILQGQTHMSRVKILVPWAKGVQNLIEKAGFL